MIGINGHDLASFTPGAIYEAIAVGIVKLQRLSGLPEEQSFPYGWSRDGQHFAFTRGRENSDAVLISDFK